MKTTHTPGPWASGPISKKSKSNGMGRGYYVNGPDQPDVNGVPQLPQRIADCWFENAEANARAISAVPEAIEACEARLREWHSNTRNMEKAEPESVKLARAAIAKVRGEG